jgi:hypothetical protein
MSVAKTRAESWGIDGLCPCGAVSSYAPLLEAGDPKTVVLCNGGESGQRRVNSWEPPDDQDRTKNHTDLGDILRGLGEERWTQLNR